MCLLCIEFQKQRMTLFEARRAFAEMREGLPPGHAEEVEEMLVEAEKEEQEEPLGSAPGFPVTVTTQDD